jgi:hypothetical protein
LSPSQIDLARLEAAQITSRCEGHMSAPSCPVLEMLEAE